MTGSYRSLQRLQHVLLRRSSGPFVRRLPRVVLAGLTALLLYALTLCNHARGAEQSSCDADSRRARAAVSLRVDNDVLGSQDQGYSNGVQLMLSSSDVSGVSRIAGVPDPYDGAAGVDESCHWPVTRWLARRMRPLAPEGAGPQNLTLSLVQAIFTPQDFRQQGLIVDDRPYAAALLLGLGYNARRGARLQSNLLQAGIVGPSARGRQAQNEIHDLVGDPRFRGWDNQLSDEGVFRLRHERLRRYGPFATQVPPNVWRWDGIARWGASLGNLLTQLNAGGELRFGQRIPDDFGTTPSRGAGEPLAAAASPPAERGFATHAFVSADARWVLRDISLDGNTFRDSHQVDKLALVAEFGYGFALGRGPWQVILARVHRTREFKGQKNRPVFGSVSIRREF